MHSICKPGSEISSASKNSTKRDASGRAVHSERQGAHSDLLSAESARPPPDTETEQIQHKRQSGQTLITSFVEVPSTRPCSVKRTQQLTKLACRAIYQDFLPTSAFENSGFQSVLELTEPKFQAPCHRTVMRHIEKNWNEGVRLMKLKLAQMCTDNYHPSITCDFWSSGTSLAAYLVLRMLPNVTLQNTLPKKRVIS